MKSETPHYFSFLLRLWQEKSEDRLTWRASLENPRSGERLGFSDIPKFLTHIVEITEEGKPQNSTSPEQKTKKNQ